MKRLLIGACVASLVLVAASAQGAVVRQKFCGSISDTSDNLKPGGAFGGIIDVGDYFQGFSDVDDADTADSGPDPTVWTGPGLGSLIATGAVTVTGSLDTITEASGSLDADGTIDTFVLVPSDPPITAMGSVSASLTGAGNAQTTPLPDFNAQALTSGTATVSLTTSPDIAGPVSITASIDFVVFVGNEPGPCVPPVPAVPVWGLWALGGILAATSAAMLRMKQRS